MMEERGIYANHTTIMRWVYEYASQFKKRMKKFLKKQTTHIELMRLTSKSREYANTCIESLIQREILLIGC
jgi:transposase-like protein